jgi:hypothetical protein
MGLRPVFSSVTVTAVNISQIQDPQDSLEVA